MSEQETQKIDDGGPAFPVTMECGDYTGMSLRDYACIQLRVAATCKPWLNMVIDIANRQTELAWKEKP